jgi:hypothetical protein
MNANASDNDIPTALGGKTFLAMVAAQAGCVLREDC